jgi:hypothetical protein
MIDDYKNLEKVSSLRDMPQCIKDKYYNLSDSDKQCIYRMSEVLTKRIVGLSQGGAMVLLAKIGSCINGKSM